MNNIVLVGFMGTGKSLVGKLLAKRLKKPFIDLDRKIEKDAGKSVAAIFSKQGEPEFRKLEAKAVKEAAALENHVIATGGGIMLNEENVELLKAGGKVICLTAQPEVILERTQASLPFRPLLAEASDPKARIEELLKLRAPFYARADLAIDTSDLSAEQVVEKILLKI